MSHDSLSTDSEFMKRRNDQPAASREIDESPAISSTKLYFKYLKGVHKRWLKMNIN